jgi:hypothetical protein
MTWLRFALGTRRLMPLRGIARSLPMMPQVGLIGWSKKPSMTWTPAAAPIDEASSKPAFLASLSGVAG